MFAIVLIGIGGLACAVLFALGLVAPGKSRTAQNQVGKRLEEARGELQKAPGRLGKWLTKPFGKSQQATNKSARAGRKTRLKLPF